jgi:hypothetical protein
MTIISAGETSLADQVTRLLRAVSLSENEILDKITRLICAAPDSERMIAKFAMHLTDFNNLTRDGKSLTRLRIRFLVEEIATEYTLHRLLTELLPMTRL